MSDVLTLADVLAAADHLRRANVPPADDGYYALIVAPRQRGWFLGMSLADAWDRNLRERWAARERALRGGRA